MRLYDSLSHLRVGESAFVHSLKNTGSMRRRLLDIGIVENTKIECVGKSPFGDPCSYLIRGAVIAIRKQDCDNIIIKEKSYGIR